jgi:hypothetical protein
MFGNFAGGVDQQVYIFVAVGFVEPNLLSAILFVYRFTRFNVVDHGTLSVCLRRCECVR